MGNNNYCWIKDNVYKYSNMADVIVIPPKLIKDSQF